MKLNLRIASLLVIIGIFGISSVVFAQKTTTNKAQPKSGAKSATPKKAKNINTSETASPNTTNQRPPSTGTGNGNDRPESTGEALSEFELIDYSYSILTDIARFIPNENVKDNSGANASRLRSFAEGASENAYQLREAYYREKNRGGPRYYPSQNLNTMNEVKYWLEKALGYLNRVEYGYRNNKADAIEKTEQAIAQAQSYIDNPPPPTKTAPNGAEAVKGKGNRKVSDGKKAVNTNTIDSTLKTTPAGSSVPAKPAKTTNTKPKATGKTTKPTNNLGGDDDPEFQPQAKAKSKASSKTTKPTNNLDPLDDPWGKTPSKTKKKVNN